MPYKNPKACARLDPELFATKIQNLFKISSVYWLDNKMISIENHLAMLNQYTEKHP
jgi:hypothetical protein